LRRSSQESWVYTAGKSTYASPAFQRPQTEFEVIIFCPSLIVRLALVEERLKSIDEAALSRLAPPEPRSRAWFGSPRPTNVSRACFGTSGRRGGPPDGRCAHSPIHTDSRQTKRGESRRAAEDANAARTSVVSKTGEAHERPPAPHRQGDAAADPGARRGGGVPPRARAAGRPPPRPRSARHLGDALRGQPALLQRADQRPDGVAVRRRGSGAAASARAARRPRRPQAASSSSSFSCRRTTPWRPRRCGS